MDWQAFAKSHEARATAPAFDNGWRKCVVVTHELLASWALLDKVQESRVVNENLQKHQLLPKIRAEIAMLEDLITQRAHRKEDLEVDLAMKQVEVDFLIKQNEPFHRQQFELAESVTAQEIELKHLRKELLSKQNELADQTDLHMQLARERSELEQKMPSAATSKVFPVVALPEANSCPVVPPCDTEKLPPKRSGRRTVSLDVEVRPLAWDLPHDTRDGTVSLEKHRLSVVCCRFGRTIQYIATGGADGRICVSDGYSSLTCIEQPKTVMALDFSSGGEFMVSGSWDASITIYDTRSWTVKRTLKDNKDCVNDVIFGAGDSVISCFRDGTVKLYDVRRSTAVKRYQVMSKAFSVARVRGDGIYMTGHFDGHVRGWDFRQEKCAYDLQAHQEAVLRVVGDLGSREIITLSAGGTIAVRDMRTGNVSGMVRLLGGIPSDHMQIALLETYANPIVIVGGRNGSIYYYDIQKFRLLKEVKTEYGPVMCVDCSISTSRLVSGHQSGVAKLWQTLPDEVK